MTDSTRKSDLHIFKFVLTGGPCAGKTTAFSVIKKYLLEHDYRVYMVPEAATLLFINGVAFDDLNYPERQYAMQQSVLNMQMQLENSFENVARSTGRKCVLLCDRGYMCGSAYIDREPFLSILKEKGLTVTSARDGRYDGIMHLVTAADGAEAHYTLDNNDARSEDLSAAINVDKNVQDVWSGCPNHYIFDNSHPSFAMKMDALVSRIAKELSLPHPRHVGDTYLPPTVSFALQVETFPTDDEFLPGTKAFYTTTTFLYTALTTSDTEGLGAANVYTNIGLHIPDSQDTISTDGVDVVTGGDGDGSVKPSVHRRVVARFVTKRVPVPLPYQDNVSTTKFPATYSAVVPSTSTVSKQEESGLGSVSQSSASVHRQDEIITEEASYTLHLLREIEGDTNEFYMVHMCICESTYNQLLATQRDGNRRTVHQMRYNFISNRQPITIIRNVDDWLLANCTSKSDELPPPPLLPVDAANCPPVSSAGVPCLPPADNAVLPAAWIEINTEGSPPNVIPEFLRIGMSVCPSNLQFLIWTKAEIE